MEENTRMDLNLDTRNLRKAAFAVGVGLTVGKYVGGCVNGAIDAFLSSVKEGLLKKSEIKKD